MQAALNSFANDSTFQAVIVLIILDLVLGVAAAAANKEQRFSFAKLSQFAQDDLLGKVFPWFVIYAAWKYAPNVDVLGIDLEVIQKGIFVAVAVALLASMASSLADLGVPMPALLSRGETPLN
jgi:hypothetical protein